MTDQGIRQERRSISPCNSTLYSGFKAKWCNTFVLVLTTFKYFWLFQCTWPPTLVPPPTCRPRSSTWTPFIWSQEAPRQKFQVSKIVMIFLQVFNKDWSQDGELTLTRMFLSQRSVKKKWILSDGSFDCLNILWCHFSPCHGGRVTDLWPRNILVRVSSPSWDQSLLKIW